MLEGQKHWTAADDAELDVLVWALATGYFEHKAQCSTCKAGYPPCPSIGKAIAAVVDWHEARQLLTRAQTLRAEHDAAT